VLDTKNHTCHFLFRLSLENWASESMRLIELMHICIYIFMYLIHVHVA
jgi:hypothetical protein